MDFSQVEAEYTQLKGQFEAGSLTEEQFKSQLQDLMLQDEAGDWWVIGYETGQWYRHDGTDWVRVDPPGQIEAGTPPPPDSHPESTTSKTVTQSTVSGFMDWRSVVLISVGWGIVWGVTWLIAVLFGVEDMGFFPTLSLICGALSGLICGLVLRSTMPVLRWFHILLIAVGWAIGLFIGPEIFFAVIVWDNPLELSTIINTVIMGLIGGSATGLTLKWAFPHTKWQQVFIIAGGWALALTIGIILSPKIAIISHYISVFTRFAVTGLMIGALGSGIMFWQLGLLKKAE